MISFLQVATIVVLGLFFLFIIIPMFVGSITRMITKTILQTYYETKEQFYGRQTKSGGAPKSRTP